MGKRGIRKAPLRVYTDNFDFIVAANLDDLKFLLFGRSIYNSDEVEEIIDDYGAISQQSKISIAFEDDDLIPGAIPTGASVKKSGIADYIQIVTATAEEWAKSNGRGFLCSTE